jgi:hypothetical protein
MEDSVKWTTDYFKAYVTVTGWEPYANKSKSMFRLLVAASAADPDNRADPKLMMDLAEEFLENRKDWTQ